MYHLQAATQRTIRWDVSRMTITPNNSQQLIMMQVVTGKELCCVVDFVCSMDALADTQRCRDHCSAQQSKGSWRLLFVAGCAYTDQPQLRGGCVSVCHVAKQWP